ncbi:efflux RND transporter permease subunit [Alkalimarinus sediminis]|uniref:MMPL family transporter n=1 Tax=Alkalimarinus sediminis TaxID=1632866 RepID=A0A9E8HQN9_9ALTE|nr:MMPL family transporter [Alkalimarinus sediminis]UZW74756.1 MMPL family transporter [Alkalimarinus sediminis]
MINQFAGSLVKYRAWYALLSLILIVALGGGLASLHFESDYKIFFSDDNPQLLAHESNQETYTKSDNITFVIAPKDEAVFTPDTLSSIKQLTDAAWKMPYSSRVDSITNYQHTWVEEDDLVVEDFVLNPDAISLDRLNELKAIALSEPQLVNYLISSRAHATAVSVNLNLPELMAEADEATVEVVEYSRALRDKIEADNPNLKIYLIGQTVVNNTFNEMSTQDMTQLIPIMFLVIVVLLQAILRSVVGTISTVVVIGVSVLVTQGFMGWVGYAVNQVNVMSPIIILTLAVCDCVHILNNYLFNLSRGDERIAAMKESLSLNFQPILLTSLTTAIGFVSMNFSDSPPFQELGNISAFGVMAAFVFSMTLFPFIVLLLPMKARPIAKMSNSSKLTDSIAQFAISRYNLLFWGLLVFAIILVSFMFKNELNDDTVEYFHEDVPFRQAADYTQQNLTGFDMISYSLKSGESNGVNDPAYLAKVEAFSQWYLSQPEVVHVSSFTDVIKRLNRNMHNDDPEWYRLPDNRELAAQYILLYEMSLPFGLDLNNQIDSDKSSLLLTVRVKDQKAQQLIDLDLRAQQWLMENAPEMVTPGASVSIMFAHIGQRNIDSMLTGSLVALILVTLTLLVALRSFKYGLLSLLPNAFPAGMAFGIWGIFDGEVNLAVAVIFAVTLGIVVDDTVHFITKYIRARKIHGHDAKQSIEYAFTVVGKAIITTTVVLAAGFFVLAFSSFDVNASMGLMVGITIIIALIWDFLFLPSLLIKVDSIKQTEQTTAIMKEATS